MKKLIMSCNEMYPAEHHTPSIPSGQHRLRNQRNHLPIIITHKETNQKKRKEIPWHQAHRLRAIFE
jgi:hypothetical protein